MKYAYWIALIIFSLAIGIPVPGLSAEATRPLVLFDQGHGQAFVIEQTGDLQLSGLAGLFRDAGFEVKASRQTITPQLLSGVDCLVISGPFVPFTAGEAENIKKFVEQGGCVTVMIHITPTVMNLLGKLDIASTNGPLNETENVLGGGGKDFVVTHLEPHPITNRLSRFSVYGVWGLKPEHENSKIVAKTGPKARVDLNRDGKFDLGDASGEFGIIVAGALGKGGYKVFGDDALFQNRFLKDDNLLLAKNLVDWMLKMVPARPSL